MPKKKFQNLHKNLMEDRVLGLQDVVDEFKERNHFVNKVTRLPVSSLNKQE